MCLLPGDICRTFCFAAACKQQDKGSAPRTSYALSWDVRARARGIRAWMCPGPLASGQLPIEYADVQEQRGSMRGPSYLSYSRSAQKNFYTR